jgi:hypothetical protein
MEGFGSLWRCRPQDTDVCSRLLGFGFSANACIDVEKPALYYPTERIPLPGGKMACKCGSLNQSKFIAEMGIRSPGLKNIDKPTVWVFPQLIVCLDCGRAEFVVPEAELSRLAEGGAATAG